eukprot:TRINITY_DN95801_c0_g1_i1.p1 TRINITY_DN95801_c0_g1~~TRINITY_DN95801_c0_g1_i1.p1  ORF type:complete len:154 (-),score=16.50 TRINITY_DN95801_c0_g1_i1:69-506(-)
MPARITLLLFFGMVVEHLAGTPTVTICSAPDAKLHVQSYLITPTDITPGCKVNITLNGTLSEEIDDGMGHVTVSINGVPLLNNDFDVCDALKAIGHPCPLAKGPLDLSYSADLPSAIPHGTYEIRAQASTSDGSQIGCVSITLPI